MKDVESRTPLGLLYPNDMRTAMLEESNAEDIAIDIVAMESSVNSRFLAILLNIYGECKQGTIIFKSLDGTERTINLTSKGCDRVIKALANPQEVGKAYISIDNNYFTDS